VFYIRDLSKTEYAVTDANVAKYGLKTYMGYQVQLHGRPVGSLCVVFGNHRELTDDDRRIISLLAKAMSIEEEREENRRQLVEKNRQLEDFAHRVSHDLKGPIRNLGGYTSLLEKDADEFDYFKAKMNKQIDQLISLINRLLELSRAGRVLGNLNRFPFRDLMGEVLDLRSHQEIAVNVTYESEPGLIYGDRVNLENVLSNIVENAIRYRGEGRENVNLILGYEKSDGETVVTITDDGLGIEEENLERIFEPGLALERNRGTGFGLAICRRIIDAHHGTITAESPGRGQGATFILRLPFPDNDDDS